MGLPAPKPTAAATRAALRDEGFALDYEIRDGALAWGEGLRHRAPPEEFRMVGEYRFEGASNPDDEAILVVLEHPPTGTAGLLDAAYGPTADAGEADVLRRLPDARF